MIKCDYTIIMLIMSTLAVDINSNIFHNFHQAKSYSFHLTLVGLYSKTSVKGPLKIRQNKDLNDKR